MRARGTREEWVAAARRVEVLGFDVLLVPDHLNGQLAPLPSLMLAAEATSRIRLGTCLLNNDNRHPAVLAQEGATLDALTGGRVELGIGAGWHRAEYERA